MSILDRILSVVSVGGAIGGSIAGIGLLQRLASKTIVVLGLMIVSAMLGVISLVGILYAVYMGLMASGLSPLLALFYVVAVVLLVTIGFIALTYRSFNNLKENSFKNVYHDMPFTARVSYCANKFLNGFSHPGEHKKKSD
ncbi:MAG TPA: hypothetical protein DCY07_00740 [Rhodospirillaceae bacterium]|nr:hypothetical protein [Rhodospirillaceae bacterium]